MLPVLVHNGILTSTRGLHGGYQLAREPSLISVDDIVRAVTEAEGVIDGPQSLIESKIVIPALHEAETALSEALRRLTIDNLARAAQGKRLRY